MFPASKWWATYSFHLWFKGISKVFKIFHNFKWFIIVHNAWFILILALHKHNICVRAIDTQLNMHTIILPMASYAFAHLLNYLQKTPHYLHTTRTFYMNLFAMRSLWMESIIVESMHALSWVISIYAKQSRLPHWWSNEVSPRWGGI